jgi:hypothetical protein
MRIVGRWPSNRLRGVVDDNVQPFHRHTTRVRRMRELRRKRKSCAGRNVHLLWV